MNDSAPAGNNGMGLFGATMVGVGAIVGGGILSVSPALCFDVGKWSDW